MPVPVTTPWRKALLLAGLLGGSLAAQAQTGGVGIGTTTPAGQLEVYRPAQAASAAADQVQTSQPTNFGDTVFSQSFTAGVSGALQQLITYCIIYTSSSVGGTVLVEIFAGSTPTGTVLASQSLTIAATASSNSPFPANTTTFTTPATLTAGQVYCFRMTRTGGGTYLIPGLCTGNCYAAGALSTSAGWDMAFQTIMSTPAVAGQSQFLMKDGSLGLGTASPTALLDVNGSTRLRSLGTAGVVTTDASGNLSSVSTTSLGTSFVQNQTASAQSGGFNVSGAGTVGGLLTAGAGATVVGYAKLNGPSALTGATVPAIATALFTGTLPAAASSSTSVSLGGLTPARILSVSILATPTAGSFSGSAFAPNQGTTVSLGSFEYGYYIDTTGTLRLTVGSNAGSLLGAPVRVLVTYMP